MARAAQIEKPAVPFNVDGFTGCRDQRSPKFKPGEMIAVYNMMPEVRDRPAKLLTRPGYKRYCAAAGGSALQLASFGSTFVQTIDGFVGFTYVSLLICSSGVYSINHTTKTITTQLTPAQVVAAGANIASFQQACFFNGKLIVATAAGKPWTWDGTTGGGVAVLANASSGCISVTTYGGKVVFIKGTVTPTQRLEWSEEGDETIGYATAPYSNFWPLNFQGSNVLTAILGTNNALYYFRLNAGIGVITGEVDANFQTTSTKDGLSIVVGEAGHPAGAMPREGADGCVMFFDGSDRPMLIRGGQLVNLWEQLPRSFGIGRNADWDALPWNFELVAEPPNNAGRSFAGGVYYDKAWDCHVYSYLNGIAYLFDGATDRLVSIWLSQTPSGQLHYFNLAEGSSVPTVPAPFKIDGSGFLYWQDYTNEVNATRSWSDETSAGVGIPVTGTIIGPPHGSNPSLDYWFDRIDVLVEARATHTVRLGYVTSAQHKGPLTPADQVFTESGLANVPYERHVEFGLAGDVLARWLMPQIQVEAVAGQDQQTAIKGYRIEARPDAQGLGTL